MNDLLFLITLSILLRIYKDVLRNVNEYYTPVRYTEGRAFADFGARTAGRGGGGGAALSGGHAQAARVTGRHWVDRAGGQAQRLDAARARRRRSLRHWCAVVGQRRALPHTADVRWRATLPAGGPSPQISAN